MKDDFQAVYFADLIAHQADVLGEKTYIHFDAPSEKPKHTIKAGAITNLIYTSGTTGLPKGVVGRNRPGIGMYFQFTASLMINQDSDILYTCLPLFHANALFLTAGWSMGGGVTFGLDRKTDSVRRRGENISSWEVENIVEKHTDVARCAAFGTPSELGEDDVMIWVEPKQGAALDLKELIHHCVEHMAYFMVPRYIDVVDEIPQTGTLRVMKAEMKKKGVTDRTWDREKEMPDLKRNK